MGTAKRTILNISMWAGWAATVALLTAIGFEVDVVLHKSLFFARLFGLLAIVSAVLTLGLWNEAARARHTIPVEEAWKVGAAFGANFVRRMHEEAKQEQPTSFMPQPGTVDWDAFLQTPVNESGQQDSPPIKWPPGR